MKSLIGPGSETNGALNHPERNGALNRYSQGLPAMPLPTNGQYATDGFRDDSAHLRALWRSIHRHRMLVIGLTLLITTGVALYVAFKPDVYEAEAQVQVNLENINPQLSGMKSGSVIVNPVNDPAYFNTQLQLLVRPWLLRRVVKTLDIEHNPSFQPAPDSFLRRLFRKTNPPAADEGAQSGTLEELAEATRLEPFVEALQENLAVDPVKENRLPIKETRLINVSFSHTDPQLATKIVNTLADTYVRANLENKNDLNALTRDILQKRITELQNQTRASEQQLMEYAKDHEILSLDPSQNTVVERLAGLNRQLLEAENDRKLAEAAYHASLAPGAAEALAENTSSNDAAQLQNRLAELREHRAQLLVDSTEEWPEVKELDQQIAVLENQVAKNRERAGAVMLKTLETKYRQSLAREEALRAAFSQQRSETLKQNEAAIYYRVMQQEVETGKELLDGLLQRQKENDGMLAGMLNNIRVNDYAVVPRIPIGPKRLLYTAIAFVVSLGFSLGLAVLTDSLDNTMRSSEDVEKILHARTLAAIPSVDEANRGFLPFSTAAIATALQQRLPQFSQVLTKRTGGATRRVLIDDVEIDSWLNELYRQLRTSILLSNSGGVLQTILVTASLPGEGKTTTAVNTALSLARTGSKVLLIDADTRRPQVHRIFGLDNNKGLTTTLLKNGYSEKPLAVIKKYGSSGLSVLTAGPNEPNFTEVLGSEQMRKVMIELRLNFEYIIIDSPPLTHFTDGVMISQMVDGVLLVVNSGRTPTEVARQSQQLLLDAGANIIGVVLNNVKILPYDYNYYPKYHTKNENGDASSAEVAPSGPLSLMVRDHQRSDRANGS